MSFALSKQLARPQGAKVTLCEGRSDARVWTQP